MKRIVCILTFLAIILCFSSCDLILSFYAPESLKDRAEAHLGIELDDATVIEEWDNHGGFHGDGEAFVKLLCPDGFENKLTAEWKTLPLEGEAYTYFYEWGGVFLHYETGEKLIPEIKDGYWYFKSTGASNWDFAIFDCEENILYYYEFDA